MATTFEVTTDPIEVVIPVATQNTFEIEPNVFEDEPEDTESV